MRRHVIGVMVVALAASVPALTSALPHPLFPLEAPTAPAPDGIARTRARAPNLKRAGATVRVSSTTCGESALGSITTCGSHSEAVGCGADSQCVWQVFDQFDSDSCTSSGDGGSCTCGAVNRGTCVSNVANCRVRVEATLGAAVCFKAEIDYVHRHGAYIRYSPRVPPVPSASPTATPVAPSDGGKCTDAEFERFQMSCQNHFSEQTCGVTPGCAWCEAEFPDVSTCSTNTGSCEGCEVGRRAMCMSTQLSCSVNDEFDRNGDLCFNYGIDFQPGGCPNLSFEGPGISNGTSPAPSPPPIPSPSSGPSGECSAKEVAHAGEACRAHSSQGTCDSAPGCAWCSVPSPACELLGTRCSCSVSAEGRCFAVDGADCSFSFDSVVHGVTCAQLDVHLRQGQCPNVMVWTGSRVMSREELNRASPQGPVAAIDVFSNAGRRA